MIAARPTVYGLEMHLAIIQRLIDETKPKVLVVDPVTNLNAVGSDLEVKSAFTRLIDLLKMQGITTVFISLTDDSAHAEQSEIGISSLMDTWILLRNLEHNGERNRGLYVLKSRGMAHSNQIREFILTDQGVDLVNVYTGPGGVLTGTARVVQEARENAEALRRQAEVARRRRDLAHKRAALEARLRAEREQFAAHEEDVLKEIAELRMQDETVAQGRLDAAQLRDANGRAKIKRRRPLRAREENDEDRRPQ